MSEALQRELDFARRSPVVDRAGELAEVLRGKGWVTARELKGLGFDDRELREIAEDDERVVLFSHPGGRGYKLFRDVTVEEFHHGIGAFWSQIRAMTRRVLRYLREWHKLGREGR